jgi:hypothetical protein
MERSSITNTIHFTTTFINEPRHFRIAKNLLFSDVKNPFNKDSFEAVDIHISKYRVYATVPFKNGNTRGDHFIEAFNVEELQEKLNQFFAQLEQTQ